MSDVREYHAALECIVTAPLELTARDYVVLKEFGGPADVERANRAVRKVLEPPETKAVQAPAPLPRWLQPERLAKTIGNATNTILTPLVARIKALEAENVDLKLRLTFLEGHTEGARERERSR